MKVDYVIIGGGLVGLSTAYNLLVTKPGSSVRVLEKEPHVSLHQSSRNSGILHSGIQYQPGSSKARLCIEGRKLLLDFAAQHSVPYSLCGQLIVALTETQKVDLQRLYNQGKENGLNPTLLVGDDVRKREPHVRGIAGLWIPEAGIIDFTALAEALAAEVRRLGGVIATQARVHAATRTGSGWIIEGNFPLIHAQYAINCAGLHSDRIARIFGDRTDERIIPFRGEYYVLREEAQGVCKSIVSTLADADLPFVGVRFTPRLDGSIECGPQTVLALAREGYSWNVINIRDIFRMVRAAGFRKLISSNWRVGYTEFTRTFSKETFATALQQLLPDIEKEDLVPGRSGVRAQVVRPDGTLEEDFVLKQSPYILHVLNAPSPGATACLALGREITHRIVYGGEPSF